MVVYTVDSIKTHWVITKCCWSSVKQCRYERLTCALCCLVYSECRSAWPWSRHEHEQQHEHADAHERRLPTKQATWWASFWSPTPSSRARTSIRRRWSTHDGPSAWTSGQGRGQWKLLGRWLNAGRTTPGWTFPPRERKRRRPRIQRTGRTRGTTRRTQQHGW